MLTPREKCCQLKIWPAAAKHNNFDYLCTKISYSQKKWNQKKKRLPLLSPLKVFADNVSDLSEYECAGRTREFGKSPRKSPTHHILLDLAVGHRYADGQLFWRGKHAQSTLSTHSYVTVLAFNTLINSQTVFSQTSCWLQQHNWVISPHDESFCYTIWQL